MIIEMNGKERKLVFGVGFVRKLDEIYRAQVEGIEFGFGVGIAHLQLEQRNPAVLADIIHCAIQRGSTSQAIDTFVEDYAEENDGLEDLFVEVMEALGKSSVIKATLNNPNKPAKVKAE